MENQIKTLLDDIKTDYINWSTSNGTKPISSYTQGVLDAFDDNVEVKYGQKYIKILRNTSTWVTGLRRGTPGYRSKRRQNEYT